VSDALTFSICAVNLDTGAVKAYPFGSQILTGAITDSPAGVAITDNGQIDFTTFDQNGDGSPILFQLNPDTGSVRGITGHTEGNYPYGRLAVSADNSRIYFNNSGQIGYVNTTNGMVTMETQGGDLGQGGYELVLAPNQTSVSSDGFMMDSDLNIVGFRALNWRESFDADYLYGATLSPDGGLLFQPGSKSIDIRWPHWGISRTRVSFRPACP